MPKLFETPGPGRRWPVRVKKHSKFVGGHTITVLGTRWSRTWGILPRGNRRSSWTGGLSWTIKGVEYGETLTRNRIALCKWRYR